MYHDSRGEQFRESTTSFHADETHAHQASTHAELQPQYHQFDHRLEATITEILSANIPEKWHDLEFEHNKIRGLISGLYSDMAAYYGPVTRGRQIDPETTISYIQQLQKRLTHITTEINRIEHQRNTPKKDQLSA